MQIPTPATHHYRYLKRKETPPHVWAKSTLSKILTNETYCGLWHYGKSDRTDGRRCARPKDEQLAVEVPALVSRATWEAVQRRKRKNKRNAKRNARRQYLMRRQLTCGACGRAMRAHATTKASGGAWLYYECNGRCNRTPLGAPCDAPRFRADAVDAAVWQWLKGLFMDEAALLRSFEEYRKHQDQVNKPLWDRLEIIAELLEQNREKHGKLLELYLKGHIDKEQFVTAKQGYEEAIAGLEHEQEDVLVMLEDQTLSEEHVQCITEFAREIGAGVAEADQDFARRRQLVELLDVTGELIEEDGEKVACLHIKLVKQDTRAPIASTGSRNRGKGTADGRC